MAAKKTTLANELLIAILAGVAVTMIVRQLDRRTPHPAPLPGTWT